MKIRYLFPILIVGMFACENCSIKCAAQANSSIDVVSSCDDVSVKVDVLNCRTGDRSGFSCARFSPDGRWIAVGFNGGEIVFYNIDSKSSIIKAMPDQVLRDMKFVFHPDCRQMAIAGRDFDNNSWFGFCEIGEGDYVAQYSMNSIAMRNLSGESLSPADWGESLSSLNININGTCIVSGAQIQRDNPNKLLSLNGLGSVWSELNVEFLSFKFHPTMPRVFGFVAQGTYLGGPIWTLNVRDISTSIQCCMPSDIFGGSLKEIFNFLDFDFGFEGKSVFAISRDNKIAYFCWDLFYRDSASGVAKPIIKAAKQYPVNLIVPGDNLQSITISPDNKRVAIASRHQILVFDDNELRKALKEGEEVVPMFVFVDNNQRFNLDNICFNSEGSQIMVTDHTNGYIIVLRSAFDQTKVDRRNRSLQLIRDTHSNSEDLSARLHVIKRVNQCYWLGSGMGKTFAI